MKNSTNFLSKSLKRFFEKTILLTFGLIIAAFSTATAQTIIPLSSGMQMTCQFINNTNGAYADSQIYVIAIGLNSSNQYCYCQPNGTMTPFVAGQNASSFFTPLSAMNGFQFPPVMTSCRLYVSLGTTLNIPINPGTPVGIAYPNIDNPSDPNINTVFDWIEFNVGNNLIFCNTTQVDMFGIPMLMQLYDNNSSGGGYSLFGTVGVTEPISQIMSEYTASVPAAFAGLEGSKRILAPIHGSFGASGANAGYFDSYINSVWSQYTTSNLVINMPTAVYTGRVGSDGRLAFTTPGDSNTYYVSKPSTNDVWGGAGALATGNSVELALEAQICAAFHRHVIDNAANLTNPAAFYQSAPADYYSQFWHEHNVGAAAYGFCYDDVDNQSSSLVGTSPRALVLTIGGGNGNTATPTPSFTPTATPITASTWRVNAGGPQYTDSLGQVWAADENFTGGTAAVTTSAITGALPGTADQTLYQSQRYGNPFSYTFNVPAGSYQVTLKFSETYWTAVGQRIFNTAINGVTVLTNFDVFSTAGGQNKAVDEVFNNISPASGKITLYFGPANVDNAMISAIQIIPMPSTPTSTPTFTFTATKSNTPTATSTLSYTATTTATSTMSNTPTNTYTTTPVNTSTFTSTGTSTLTNTATKTMTPTATNTLSYTPTATLTSTATLTFTPTKTPILTNTPANTSSATSTSTYTFTTTGTMSPTATATNTLSATPTATITNSSTATATKTNSVTATATLSFTNTPTGTATAANTSTATATNTLSKTPTTTWTNTPSFTQTSTSTKTPTSTLTVSFTPTFTPTFTSTSMPPTSTPTIGGCSGLPNWNGNFVAYALGQKVDYNGEIYQCIQAHTSELNWMPPAVPALWKDLGPCGSTPTAALSAAKPLVYPNPVTSSVAAIQLPMINAVNVKVQVYTLSFREIKTVSFPQVTGNSFTMEMVDKVGAQLANGVYYFAIQANGQHWTNKVLVLR